MGKKAMDGKTALAQVIGAADAADLLEVTRTRVNVLAVEGRLISVKIGGNTRIFWRPDVEAFAKESRPVGNPKFKQQKKKKK